jgi:5-keto 4-deoxyuronate isomerase
MTVKITLITPPDIFENDNESVLLLNLSEEQQNLATDWLGRFETDRNLNIYFYQNETEVPWIFHAMGVSKYKYIDVDATKGVSQLLISYILSKPNTYYSTSDANTHAVYSYINSNSVTSVVEFLERTLGA